MSKTEKSNQTVISPVIVISKKQLRLLVTDIHGKPFSIRTFRNRYRDEICKVLNITIEEYQLIRWYSIEQSKTLIEKFKLEKPIQKDREGGKE